MHEDPEAIYRGIHKEFEQGTLASARTAAHDAVSRFSTSGIQDHAWEDRFRLLEAEITIYQGRTGDALVLLDQQHQLQGENAVKQKLLLSLAQLSQHDAALAENSLREARRLAEIQHSSLMGEVLRTEGQFAVKRDDLATAAERFRESLAQAYELHDDYLAVTNLLNLGYVALQRERYDEAIPQLTQAEGFALRIGAKTLAQAALGNLGETYLQLGDFERALYHYTEAQGQAEALGATSSSIIWLQDMGWCYFKMGDFESARRIDQRALAAAQEIHANKQIVSIETNLAFLLYRQGLYMAAEGANQEALRAAGGAADEAQLTYPRYLEALLKARHASVPEAEKLLLAAHGRASADAALRWDAENSLGHYYALQGARRKAEIWYRRSAKTFETQRSLVSDEALRLSFFANGDRLYQDYARFLIDNHHSTAALKLLDSSRAQTLESGLGMAPQSGRALPINDARAVARKLGVVILFYSLGPEASYLWTIDAHRVRLSELPAQADIETLFRRHETQLLRSEDPLQERNSASVRLYDTLIEPAQDMIAPGAKVLIVPDGVLNALNFETLVKQNAQGNAYWIELVTLQTSSAIGLLSHRKIEQPPSNTLLLIGDPLPSEGFQSLPQASAEIDKIQRHFDPALSTIVARSEAVPAAYGAHHPERFAYIHFVAHGISNRLSPLDSAVVLSSATQDGPFKLYAHDIVQVPLHATLVTVSACFSAGSRAYAGEGFAGLAWAFLRAGSHRVIGALWQASDASTPVLMDHFYAALQAGEPPEQALRNAKLALLHSDSVFRKPLYWGPFQLYVGS